MLGRDLLGERRLISDLLVAQTDLQKESEPLQPDLRFGRPILFPEQDLRGK